ncbi:tyrosine-type recombinase/integrase [Agromyces sp. PvR057]|uniref:site-specific integrase n=1 Tax=Agromyces sp. PvR057 TaxID=3156403 RepID=UPI00339B71C7
MTGRQTKRRETFGTLRKRESGRYQATYMGPDGKRHSAPTTFQTMGDARAYLRGVQARIASGTWQSADTERAEHERRALPFAAFATRWLDGRTSVGGKALRPTTLAEYRRLLAGPLAPLADLPLPSITRAVVEDWRTPLLMSGTRTQAARAYTLLSAIMGSAVDRGLIDASPCTIRGAASTRTGKRVNPPTRDELATIVEHVPERYRMLVLLAAWSGLRFGELSELRRKDIHGYREAEGLIELHVSRGVVHVAGQGAVVGPPKTSAGERVVALPSSVPGLYDALRAHLAERVGAYPDALLFTGADGESHLRQSTVAKVFYPARETAGRPDLPWHGLRHFAASQYAAAGATEAEIMARQGQRSPGMVRRYVHTTGREADLAARMGA